MAKKQTEPKPIEIPTPKERHKYVCSRGHGWESTGSLDGNSISLTIGAAGTIGGLCPHCLLDLLKKLTLSLGRVKELDG